MEVSISNTKTVYSGIQFRLNAESILCAKSIDVTVSCRMKRQAWVRLLIAFGRGGDIFMLAFM